MCENKMIPSNYPDWLKNLDKELPNFDFKQILKDSFYYPACGVDIEPIIHFFPEFMYSFIYCDYSVNKGELRRCMINKIEKKFKLIHKLTIPLSVIRLASADEVEVYMKYKKPDIRFKKDKLDEPYTEWYIFYDKQSNKYLSLLYICSEGQMVFNELYVKNKIAPKVLGLIYPGMGFGHNYNSFVDDLHTIIKETGLRPQFLCDKMSSDSDDSFSIIDKKLIIKKNSNTKEFCYIRDYNVD